MYSLDDQIQIQLVSFVSLIEDEEFEGGSLLASTLLIEKDNTDLSL